ncbi:hypothetical protein C8J57DRAFT_1722899 [Mycena rebaudengoi]|nr:hypothetical protein C8J57DRAFT_1722899 [Mycena rebaudengoi]
MQPAHDVTMRSSAISALAPAHDANLTIQPLSTGLSVTILGVICAPPAASLRVVLQRLTQRHRHSPSARTLLTHRLHQADFHVFGVRTDARKTPSDPTLLFELPPTDSVNAGRALATPASVKLSDEVYLAWASNPVVRSRFPEYTLCHSLQHRLAVSFFSILPMAPLVTLP